MIEQGYDCSDIEQEITINGEKRRCYRFSFDWGEECFIVTEDCIYDTIEEYKSAKTEWLNGLNYGKDLY